MVRPSHHPTQRLPPSSRHSLPLPGCSWTAIHGIVMCVGMLTIYGANANALRMLYTYLDVQRVHATG